MKMVLRLILINLILLSCGKNHQDSNDKKFDSEEWLKGNMKTKGEMTNNLLEINLLEGKNKSQVLTILGEPDQQTKSRIHYTVDPGIKYMNESWTYWLTVEFDTIENKVEKVWLSD